MTAALLAATVHERGQLPPDLMLAAVDEHGLLPLCCSAARSDGFIAGVAEGHAAGMEAVRADLDAAAVEVVRGAARSLDVMAARCRPYAVPSWAGGPS